MKIPCEYCGQMISETEQNCPCCGAANKRVKRTAYGVPTTIEELRAYCRAHNLPLQDMRVFIGEDYRGAKAFGIYRDEATGSFIVYKNKADGSRAVRYEGNDEAYAVNELYLKMKERVEVQKSHQRPKREKKPVEPHRFLLKSLVFQLIILTMAVTFPMVFWRASRPSRGYYDYQGNAYYYDRSDWYEWDDGYGEWTPVKADSELKRNYDNYYQSASWDSSQDAGNFEDSVYYREADFADDDSDYDWDDDDWDYDWDDDDSWDSGYDDWDSDW